MNKVFTIQGKPLRLYTIGELATAILRSPITIRKWERYGLIPGARYRDQRGRRLYALAEIRALVQIVEEENPRTGVAFNGLRLKERVKAAWDEIRRALEGPPST